jgi:hypothetical protein
LYSVRYWHEGKLLASKWCTHTNDEEAARKYAIENKARIVGAYLEKKDVARNIYTY